MSKTPVIIVTTEMLAAGVNAYNKWVARKDAIYPEVQLRTLADEMYRAMERVKTEHEADPEVAREFAELQARLGR